MKRILVNLKQITLACGIAASGLAVSTAHADTTNVFSIQKGNLTKDGSPYGSGSGYLGVLDGVLADANATALLTTGQTAAVGNSFKSGSPNGQQNCAFFAYDLTDLKDFITANNSISSTATVASVSFSIIANAAAATGGGNYAWGLYGTDPFTSSCTWSNYDGVTPWTANPFQNLTSPNNTVQYGYTGGGSGNTTTYPLLNTNTVFLNGVAAGNPLTLSGGVNFISAVTNALAQTDKTLYLTLRIPTFVNGDSRQVLIFSPTNTVASRPKLQVTVVVVGTPPASSDLKWTGANSATWDTSTVNWNDGANDVAYSDGKNVTFDDTLSNPANNNITLSGTYSPTNILASNSTYDYSLTDGGLTGNMTMNKQGGATFALGMSNSYSGLTTVSGGTLLITHSNALGSAAAGTVVASGGSLALSNGITLSGEPITINGTGAGSPTRGALRTFDANNFVTVAAPITLGSDSRIQTGIASGKLILAGPITDNGSNYNLSLNAGQANSELWVNSPGNTTISNLTLYTYLPPPNGGTIFFGVDDAFPSALLYVGQGFYDLNGKNQAFAGITNSAYNGFGIITNSSATPSTLTLNVSGTKTVSLGSAIKGLVSVVKNGTGTQQFTGGATNAYTGTTTINEGVLGLASRNMDGCTGAFIVKSNATLRGQATIGGSIEVKNGGLFYPAYATNAIGFWTNGGNLTLESGSTTIAAINPDISPSNSIIHVSGTTTYGGKLVIYSIGHTNALQAGQEFTIFPTGGTGNFDEIVFNTIESQPNVGYSFDGPSGKVTITSTPAPTLSITPQGGDVMQINWDSSFYKLQWQTNALDTGLSDNWISYPTFNGQATVNWTNDTTIGSTFFRLAPKP